MPQFSFDLASLSDHRECRRAIRERIKSFYAASRLLPAQTRKRAFALYAFCRLSDDAIDLSGGSKDALERLRDRLGCAARGRPQPYAADRAMADLMRRCAIPAALPEALLEGLAWDSEGRSYETIDELFDYAARVAGAVGVMMALIMDVRSPQALARACDLGVAMQLTNIARDVGEDARLGRIYLPRQWLREAGIDADAWLCRTQPRRTASPDRRAVDPRGGCALRARPRGDCAFAGKLSPGDSRCGADLSGDRPRDRTQRLRLRHATRARVSDPETSPDGPSDARVALAV